MGYCRLRAASPRCGEAYLRQAAPSPVGGPPSPWWSTGRLLRDFSTCLNEHRKKEWCVSALSGKPPRSKSSPQPSLPLVMRQVARRLTMLCILFAMPPAFIWHSFGRRPVISSGLTNNDDSCHVEVNQLRARGYTATHLQHSKAVIVNVMRVYVVGVATAAKCLMLPPFSRRLCLERRLVFRLHAARHRARGSTRATFTYSPLLTLPLPASSSASLLCKSGT